jgi:hypothetical protein
MDASTFSHASVILPFFWKIKRCFSMVGVSAIGFRLASPWHLSITLEVKP